MNYAIPKIKAPTIDGLSGNIFFKEVDVRTIKQTPVDKRMKITSASDCYAVLKKYVYESNELINTFENFYVIYLNRQNNIIGFQHLSKGGIDATVVDVKIILATAMKLLASSIILSHNHPSGNIRPSDADNQITKKIKEAAKLMDISVLDHIIVTDESYFSYAEEGLLGLSGINNISFLENNQHQINMITPNNYYQEINQIGVDNLPKPMIEMHELINDLTQNGKDWNDFNSDKEIKESVSMQFQKLYEWIKKNKVDETASKKTPKKHSDRRKGHRPKRRPVVKKRTEVKPSVQKKAVEKKAKPKVTKAKKPKPAVKSKKTTALKIKSWNVFKAENPTANKEIYFLYVEMMHAQGAEIPATINKQMDMFQKQTDEPVSPDLRFIKRFVKLHAKTISKDDVLRFVKSLQKSIRERQINKKSLYHSQIAHIQSIMVDLYNNKNLANTFKLNINSDTLKKYEKILDSRTPMNAVKLLKRFILLQGKNDMEKFDRLYADIAKELENLEVGSFYYKALQKANKLIRGGNISSELSEQELNGLLGVNCFCSKKKSSNLSGFDKLNSEVEQLKNMIPKIQPKYGVVMPKNNLAGFNNESNVMTAQEVLNRKFQVINFVGKFKKLLGDPELGFSMMIFGKPKSGKSTFAIDFAQYLAENHGKVLFVSVEEGISHTLADKIKRLQANSKNLFFDKQIPIDLKLFDFVFIDSINRAKLSIAELIELQNKYPQKTFVYIFQVTKDGNFRGSQEFEHEVDIVVNIDSGIASAKGRYAQGESIAVRF